MIVLGVRGSASIRVGPRRFHVPKIDGVLCQPHEPWMIDLLSQLLPRRPGTFLDIGANLGQTLLAVKGIDPDRHYVGAEPNPFCIAYIERVMDVNRIANAAILPVGVGSEAAILTLFLYGETEASEGATILKDFRPQKVTGTKFVPILPFAAIDHALDLSRLAWVKIDVEGAEANVLESMRGAITATQPWLMIEILPCHTPENTERVRRQEKVEALLRDLGYALFRVEKSKANEFRSLSRISEIGIHDDLDRCDYLCCPEADVSGLTEAC